MFIYSKLHSKLCDYLDKYPHPPSSIAKQTYLCDSIQYFERLYLSPYQGDTNCKNSFHCLISLAFSRLYLNFLLVRSFTRIRCSSFATAAIGLATTFGLSVITCSRFFVCAQYLSKYHGKVISPSSLNISRKSKEQPCLF